MQSHSVREPHKEIFFDENLPGLLAKALNVIETKEGKLIVKTTVTEFGAGITDELLVEEIGKRKGVLITHDHRLRTHPGQRNLYLENKIGIVFLKYNPSFKYLEIARFIFTKWWDLRVHLIKKHPPFSIMVPSSGKLRIE